MFFTRVGILNVLKSSTTVQYNLHKRFQPPQQEKTTAPTHGSPCPSAAAAAPVVYHRRSPSLPLRYLAGG